MKKGFYILSTILLGISLLCYSKGESFGSYQQTFVYKEEMLTRTLLNSSFSPVEYNIMGWMAVDNEVMDKQQLKERAIMTIKDFNLEQASINEQYTEDQGFQGYRISGISNLGPLIEVYVQSLNLDQMKETYILVSLTSSDEFIQYPLYRSMVEQSFKEYNDNPQIASVFVMANEGKINNEDGQETVDKVFKAVHGKKIEGINTESLISWSGYTDKLKDSIQVGANKININAALTYNEQEDRTYLLVGTPVISTEY